MKTSVLLAGIICLLTIPTSAYMCGDANGDQTLNIGDAVYLVDYIFRSGPPPVPLDAGDPNVDLSVNVGDAVYLIGHIFKGGPPPCPAPNGSVVEIDGCKPVIPDGTGVLPENLECIEYDYRAGTLYLTHLNGEFNCCVESIHALVTVADGWILIYEVEDFGDGSPCYCICPFDVDIEIAFLPPRQYIIHVDLLGGTPSPIEFEVDLELEPSGIFCVE
jgi:hypothetical protein